jgi:uncharacterized protein YegL
MEDFTFDTFSTPNQFQFSAIGMENLGATEYSLIGVVVDQSGSVHSFKTDLEDAIWYVIESCQKHPRSQNLLVRTTTFSGCSVDELHGFTTIDVLDKGRYVLNPNGQTPLMDAVLESVDTLNSYAKSLNDNDFFVNGCIFCITDGSENSSQFASMSKIRDAVNKIRTDESMESIQLILIGVNDSDASLKATLEQFKNDAGFDQYISIGDANPSKLAKLANWVSQSISSTSQALGSGQSKAVNFTL